MCDDYIQMISNQNVNQTVIVRLLSSFFSHFLTVWLIPISSHTVVCQTLLYIFCFSFMCSLRKDHLLCGRCSFNISCSTTCTAKHRNMADMNSMRHCGIKLLTLFNGNRILGMRDSERMDSSPMCYASVTMYKLESCTAMQKGCHFNSCVNKNSLRYLQRNNRIACLNIQCLVLTLV
jgi:hypothetical protein